MTTPEDHNPLSPERDAAVRRLLGSVGDAPALPPDVADRLDATLADLVAERADGPTPTGSPVVDLAARRRRRTGAGLFVAAAAVVVVGIGVSLAQDHTTDVGSAAREQAPDRTPTMSGPRHPTGPPTGAKAGTAPQAAKRNPAPGSEARTLGGSTRVPRVRPSHLRPDLLALRHRLSPDASYDARTVTAPPGFTCARAPFGKGALLGVRYAGGPAVVAYRRPTDSTQVVEVLQCGTGRVLRSVTLPLR